MVRATHGVHRGSYYFEVEILRSYDSEQSYLQSIKSSKCAANGHVRVGWSTRQGDLQAPVGFDQYSYAYRDTDGNSIEFALLLCCFCC